MPPKWRVVVALALVSVLSCTDATSVGKIEDPWGLGDLLPSLAVIPSLPATCGPVTVTTFIADKTVPVGTVEVANDEDHLYVVYRTTAAWPILNTALFVGDSPNEIPLSGGGNPRVGKFPYKSSHRDGPTEVVWEIPRATLSGPSAVIAAFAQVGASMEGAWGQGPMISNGGNWSMYFTHELANCAVEPIGPTGGAVTTPDGSARILIPAGALPALTDLALSCAAQPGGQQAWEAFRASFNALIASAVPVRPLSHGCIERRWGYPLRPASPAKHHRARPRRHRQMQTRRK
jgi:hypothetical protein